MTTYTCEVCHAVRPFKWGRRTPSGEPKRLPRRCKACTAAIAQVRLSVIEGCWKAGWLLDEIAAVMGRRGGGRGIGPEVMRLRREGRIGRRNSG